MAMGLLRNRPLAALTVAGLVAGLVIGLAGSAATSGVAKKEKRASGSVPNRMAVAWSINVARSQNGIVTDILGDAPHHTPKRGDGAIAVSDKVIAIADGFDVQLLDPATGKLRKRISRVRVHEVEPVIGLWVSGDILIVETGKIGVIKDVWIDGFEYTTGRLLWSTSSLWDHFGPPKIGVSSGVVVRQEQNRDGFTVLAALAADTGRLLWSMGPICPSRAGDEDLAPAGKVLAVLVRCGNGEKIFGIGLVEGSIRWRKQFHTATGGICLAADGGPVIMVDSGDWFSLLGPTGEILLTRQEARGLPCAIHTTSRGVVIARNSVIQLIDPQSKRIYWQKYDLNRTSNTSRSVSGRFYHEPASGSELLPSFVSSTDFSTGDTVTLPLPVRGNLVDSTKNVLIYQTNFTRTIRYTGVRPETGKFPNPVLAGAAPSDWPNACGLLSSADLDSLGGFTAFPERKPADAFGVKLPHPTGCNYLAVGSDIAFSVTVSWVGGNRTELVAMLESQATDTDPTGTPEKLGADAFIVPDSRIRLPVSEVFLLHGSYALHVRVPENDQDDNGKLARKVAKILLPPTRDSDQKSNTSVPFDIDAAYLMIRSYGYDPDPAPTPPGPLRAITAICADSATSHCQQVFFFFGQDFVGVGSGEDQNVEHRAIYRGVKINGQDGQTVRMEYAVYGPNDGNCCPSAQQPQAYRYKNDMLEYRNDTGVWQPAPKEPIELG